MLERRRRRKLSTGSQAREYDEGQVVHDIFWRIRVHGGGRRLSLHEESGGRAGVRTSFCIFSGGSSQCAFQEAIRGRQTWGVQGCAGVVNWRPASLDLAVRDAMSSPHVGVCWPRRLARVLGICPASPLSDTLESSPRNHHHALNRRRDNRAPNSLSAPFRARRAIESAPV
jgi:hypothetical protein